MTPGQRKIFRGKLIDVSLRRQKLPSGFVVDLEVVEHPGAVLIVPFLSEDRIILIRQYRPVIRSYIWELPAGTLNKGEKPLACAKRELIEEIGYTAELWENLGFIYPAPGYTTEKIHLYAAKRLHKVRAQREEDEIIRPRVFTRREIANLLETRKIVDAKSICALALSGIIAPR
ncbi:MAG: NUDIX hydrolase [Candidatus Aureabacteria bacterium]|nr:NUDIX hydrolase [Candidatus Auribacterota bacterium]